MRASPSRTLSIFSTLLSALSLPGISLAAGDAPAPAESAGHSASEPHKSAASAAASEAAVAQVQALADAGKFKEAEKKARDGLKADAGNAQLHNLLGFSLRKQKKWQDSVASYQEAIKLKPDFAQAKEYLAVSYLNMKEPKAAKALHDELVSTHPQLAKMIEAEAKRLKVKW